MRKRDVGAHHAFGALLMLQRAHHLQLRRIAEQIAQIDTRIARARSYFAYPQYETMVRGSRELMARAPVVRDVRVSFEVHPTMDRQFVYKILGGRIDPTARYTATINGDGSITLTE